MGESDIGLGGNLVWSGGHWLPNESWWTAAGGLWFDPIPSPEHIRIPVALELREPIRVHMVLWSLQTEGTSRKTHFL